MFLIKIRITPKKICKKIIESDSYELCITLKLVNAIKNFEVIKMELKHI